MGLPHADQARPQPQDPSDKGASRFTRARRETLRGEPLTLSRA
jgi:hypothetical protein